MSVQISIIGLGWLGLPLANALVQEGFLIKGSTTSEEKLRHLRAQNYDVYKVVLEEEAVNGEVHSCLNGSEVLILNTPPGLRRNPSGNYVTKIQKLLPHIVASGIRYVLFVGSTSVYSEGSDFPVITNKTLPNATSNSGVQLQKVEQLLMGNSNFETTILRFAGLVDERRHPATMMSKRKNIPNPKAPVNLIHREDCIGVIKAVIKQDQWGEVFNAAYPLHLDKNSYYKQICELKKLPRPDFNSENPSSGKIIDGNDTSKALKYEYRHTIL